MTKHARAAASARLLTALAALLLAEGAASARDGSPPPTGQAIGEIEVNGRALAIKYAAAVMAPYSYNEKRVSWTLLLTPQPLPAARPADLEAFIAGIKEGLIVELGPDDEGPDSQYRLTIRHPAVREWPQLARGGTFSPNDHRLEAKGPDRIAGTLTSSFGGREGGDRIMDHDVRFILHYNAPVVTRFAKR